MNAPKASLCMRVMVLCPAATTEKGKLSDNANLGYYPHLLISIWTFVYKTNEHSKQAANSLKYSYSATASHLASLGR